MALGKNLKRTKLLPDDPAPKDEKVNEKTVKKPTVKKKSVKKPAAAKKVVAERPKTKKVKLKVSKEVPTKKVAEPKKAVPKVKTTTTVPQSQKVKTLSDKERKQREGRRENYVQELALLKNKITNWIIFDIEGELFAIDIAKTQRVIPTPEISSLPHTASHIRGVAEVRKRPVIFIDFAEKYQLHKGNDHGDMSYSLIVKPANDLVAILMKKVPQTLKINGNHIIPLPETANLIPNRQSFIKYMYRLDEKIVYMLDIEGLILADQGILELQNLTETA